MADRSIRVAVLEGDFVSLSAAGFPLSLQLQESALKLPDAMWTAKSTADSFSVSLVSPHNSAMTRRRRERKGEREGGRPRPRAMEIKTVPSNTWTMDQQGVKRVEGCGANDKRLIMAVFYGSLDGDFYPFK